MQQTPQKIPPLQRFFPDNFSLQCQAESTVADALDQALQQYPQARPLLQRCACAVGEDIISRKTVLKQDTVLALLPPVAGG